jgi:hypothetical protein
LDVPCFPLQTFRGTTLNFELSGAIQVGMIGVANGAFGAAFSSSLPVSFQQQA